MSATNSCVACEMEEAPTGRGVKLCAGCTRVLLAQLRNASVGEARVIEARSYGQACRLCGEWRDRRILEHPEWGNICEVDVFESAEVHRLELEPG